MSSLTRTALQPIKTINHVDDSHPFGQLWLDSFFQEVFLSNGSWQKLLQKVNIGLAKRIEKQFIYPDRKLMIFELMGPQFVQTHFPNEEFNSRIIEAPDVITPEERKKLHLDAQNWLQKELAAVTEELGCERPKTGQNRAQTPSAEMLEFLRFVKVVAVMNMDRHLHLQEREILKSYEEQLKDEKQMRNQIRDERKRLKLQREYERITGTAPLRGILRNDSITRIQTAEEPSAFQQHGHPPPTGDSIFTMFSDVSSRTTTSNIKGAMYGAEEDPPTFWGMQSNSIGRSVVSILRRDPRRYREVAMRLHGRQLPGTMRAYLWLDMLLRKDREKLKDSNAEKIVRERFGKALSRGITDLRVKRASHSPISGLIDNAVIEIYDQTPGMKMYMEIDQHMKESARTLNILYVYDRTYEPYMIHWLFPLQLAFNDFSNQSEHVYDLAMYLDLLNKNCYPSWPQIFAVAEKVLKRLHEHDPTFHDHLEKIALINVNISPKEFLVQMIHQEKAKADALLAATPDSRKSKEMSKDILARPHIFLRKWVGEGFVGVLDSQAAMYVWDQCFLQRWDTKVLEDVCLALLLLLRHKFMAASEYREMKRVFLREPCKLYTMDIQQAWVHIQRDGDFNTVPLMNRQGPRTSATPRSPVQPAYSPVPATSPAPSVVTLKPIPSVGVKHIRLRMEIPKDNPYMSTINPTTCHLTTSLFFGSVLLDTQTSSVPGQSLGPKTDRNGNSVLTVRYPHQKFIFPPMETSQYDLEQEMGGYPYAIVQVTSTPQAGQSVSVGWCRIKLFQQRSEVEKWSTPGSQWQLLGGDFSFSLSSGEAAEQGVTRGPDDPARPKSVIGHRSEVSALVYNPEDEPRTPPATPPPMDPTPRLPTPKQPTPKPPTPKEPTPKPPTPKEPTPPPKTPELPGIKDPFMFYIDRVDNIPDNATITKVTGRMIKTGNLANMEDVLAPPELTSSARSPCYKYSVLLNENQQTADKEMLVLLRVYTINRISKKLEVIGSCLVRVFDPQTNKIRAGGHQKVLRYGMPNLKQGLGALSESALDSAARVPGCTIYYRFLAPKPDLEPPMPFDLQNYPLDGNALNQSEKRVVDSYKADVGYPKTTLDMAKQLQTMEKVTNTNTSQWLMDRLDHKQQLAPNQGAGFLDLSEMVLFRLDKGLNIHISRAFNLPEGLYTECFVQMYPGEGAQGRKSTEGYGKDDEKMVTLATDLDSHQTAPRWMDKHKTFHPHWDSKSFVLIQLFGVPVKYKATDDHKEAGTVTDAKGEELGLGEDNIIGWTVLSLFDDMYVNQGEHHLPLLKGKPIPAMLVQLAKLPLDEVLKSHTWTDDNTLGTASLMVNLWDGHFSEGELLDGLKKKETSLELVGEKDAYLAAQKNPQGPKLNQIVLDGLDPQDRAQGTNGPVYIQEKGLFSNLMEKTYLNLWETALLEAGYGPL